MLYYECKKFLADIGIRYSIINRYLSNKNLINIENKKELIKDFMKNNLKFIKENDDIFYYLEINNWYNFGFTYKKSLLLVNYFSSYFTNNRIYNLLHLDSTENWIYRYLISFIDDNEYKNYDQFKKICISELDNDNKYIQCVPIYYRY